MTSVPDIETVLLLAVVTGLDILLEVGAADVLDFVAENYTAECLTSGPRHS